MRKYEVMIIVDQDVDDRQISPLIDKHLAVITNEGGTIDNIDVWGRRRFAYEINKKSEGSYVVATLTAESASVNEIDRLMSIDEKIVRTKVQRLDNKVVRRSKDKKDKKVTSEEAK